MAVSNAGHNFIEALYSSYKPREVPLVSVYNTAHTVMPSPTELKEKRTVAYCQVLNFTMAAVCEISRLDEAKSSKLPESLQSP